MLNFLKEKLEGLQVEDDLNLPSSAIEALKVPIPAILPLNIENTLILSGFPFKDAIGNERVSSESSHCWFILTGVLM